MYFVIGPGKKERQVKYVKELADHVEAFSTGGELYSGSGAGGTGLDAAQTAAAVWSADPDNYKTQGTFGEWFRKMFWGGKRNT